MREFRDRALQRITARARALRESGESEAWFSGADSGVQGVARGVNGPLFAELAAEAGHPDLDVVEFFREARRARTARPGTHASSSPRQGAPLIGLLPQTGLGAEKSHPAHLAEDVLLDGAEERNKKFLQRDRAEAHAAALHQAACDEASLGRMTAPSLAGEGGRGRHVLVPRFGVEQGTRPDGSAKASRPRRGTLLRRCATRFAFARAR